MNFIANFAEGGDWTFRQHKKGQINKIAKIRKKEILIMINTENFESLGKYPSGTDTVDAYSNRKEQLRGM